MRVNWANNNVRDFTFMASKVAQTGVDYISVGALTHSAPALDIHLVITERPVPTTVS